MAWLIVLLVLAVCASFVMCILILGKRADLGYGLLLGVSLEDLRESDAFPPLPCGTRLLCKWRSLRPQQSPL